MRPMPASTVAQMFLDRVAATPDRDAFLYPEGSGWAKLTWRQTGEQVREIACGLRAIGLADEERCAILSGTRYEWIFVDLAILCAGGATTTIYPSNTPDECAYILKDSNSVFCFAENDAQVAKLVAKRAGLPQLKHVIVIDGKSGHDGWVLTLAELRAKGKAAHEKDPAAYERIAHAVKPESLATMIYTSGTTGQPKGVELTHDCWAYEGHASAELGMVTIDDLQYLWLPLAHSFGKVLEGLQLTVGFATAVDGRIDKLVENLGVIKPTFVAAVPRIFEKVYNKVVTGATEAGGMKAKIFRWALGVGKEVSRLRQHGQEPSGVLSMKYAVADKLVFSKLRDRFGGRLRLFVSGSAPLSRDLAEFFHAAGLLILEGYGLTETSAATFVNRVSRYKFGSVGLPVPGTKVKIAEEDGEILISGRGVMRGYHNMEEATRETLTDDRWLRTGDIGHLDGDGFLFITDRKKDLIKTSGGKYVAPQALEGKLKLICPLISQVVVHGNNRNFCSALIALDPEAIGKWASENGVANDYAALTKNDQVRAAIQGCVDQLNQGLASYETIKKIAILPQDLTEASGDLTASLKLKRKAVEQKYKSLLDGFYEGALAKSA
jgi:long-chain acyl-CoA synthetase